MHTDFFVELVGGAADALFAVPGVRSLLPSRRTVLTFAPERVAAAFAQVVPLPQQCAWRSLEHAVSAAPAAS